MIALRTQVAAALTLTMSLGGCASGLEAPGIKFGEPTCQINLDAGSLHIFTEVQGTWAYSKTNSRSREAYEEGGELYLNASNRVRLGAADDNLFRPSEHLAMTADVDVTVEEFSITLARKDYWIVTVGECTPRQRALGVALAAYSRQKL